MSKKLLTLCVLFGIISSLCWAQEQTAAQEPVGVPALKDEEDFVNLALNQSLILKRMENIVEAARSRVKATRGGLLPQVDATAVYGLASAGIETDTGTLGFHYDANVDVEQETVRTQLSMKQTLTQDTEVGDQIRLAEVEMRMALGEYERQRQQFAYRIRQAYFNFLKAREFRALQTEAVALSGQRLERVEARRKLNTATKIEQLQGEGDLAMQRDALIASLNGVSLAQDVLNNLMALPLGTALEPSVVSEVLPDVPPLEVCIATGLKNRPEVQAAQAALDRSLMMRRSAKRRYRPMLFLVGTYTWDDLDVRSTITTSGLSPAYMLLDVTPEFYEDEDIEMHDQWSGSLVGYENLTADQVGDDSQEILDWVDDELFRGQLVSQLGRTYWDYKMEDSWLVATGVRMSLFDGGIKKEMVNQTLLDEERSTNDLQILQDTITLENKKAHFSYQQAKDRIAILDNAIAQADEVLRLVKKRADLGLAASFEESDAEHALHNARSGRINAFFDAWLAKAELDHAMGIVY